MDSGLTKTIGLAILTAALATFVAMADNGGVNEAAGMVAGDTAHHDSVVAPRWVTDAGVLSLLGVINGKQVALASAELQAWRSDTVRAYAADVASGHGALQHSVDSLAAKVHIAPVVPAIQDSLVAMLQAHVDTVNASHGPQMDRVFMRQSIAANQYLTDYLSQMSAVAQAPELQAAIGAVQARVATELARAQQIQTMFAAADSVAADSVSRRAAARRNRQGTNR